MSFRTVFNIVLYEKETTWVGSLKERWGISYIPLEPEIRTVTIFYANMLIFTVTKIWLPWKHETSKP